MNQRWSLALRYIVFVLVLLAVAMFLFYIRDLLKPLAGAAFTAYLLMPVASFVSRRLRWSDRLSTNLVYFLAMALVIGLISSLVPVVLGQLEELTRAFQLVSDQINRLLETPLVVGPFVIRPPAVLPGLESLLTQLSTPVLENALQFVEATSRGVAWLFLYLISLYYFLTAWDRMREWLFRLAPSSYEADVRLLYDQVRAVWVGYLWGQITLVFIVGAVCTAVWMAIGLPGALVIGPLTGLLTLIPDVGPLIGTIIAALIALLEGSTYLPISNFWFAVLVMAIYGVLMAIKNVWVRPRVMGRSVQMHEGLVFVAILGAVVYGGVLGALMVVPVLASLGVIGRYLRQRVLGLEPFPGLVSQAAADAETLAPGSPLPEPSPSETSYHPISPGADSEDETSEKEKAEP